MKFKSVFMASWLTIFTLVSCSSQDKTDEKQNTISMENETDKISYSLGVNVALNVKSQGLENINGDVVAKAINDVYGGGELMVDAAEAGRVLNEYFQKKQQDATDGNSKAGKDFLEQNKTKEGIVSLPSGLQYKILKEGTGPKPKATDKVKTHYHGMLIDGTVFDSSVDRGEPITFPVTGVIKGWIEALQLMPVGSKWKLFIPSDLAYGARGSGPKIGPHAALIFDVELLGIE